MTMTAPAGPRTAATPQAAIRQLARIEAGRMLRHPGPWIGLAGTVWFGSTVFEQTWAAAHYQGLLAATAPLLIGVTVAAASAFTREHTPVSDEAPVGAAQRSVARLLGRLSLVALVGAVVAAAHVWLWLRGGLVLGDEPGRTRHAFYTFPELLQPVLLAALAVAIAAALSHVVRHLLAASIVAFVF